MLCKLLAIALLSVLTTACSEGSTNDERPGGGEIRSSEDAPAVPPGAADVDGWQTDWSSSTIDLSELIRGISSSDPRDVIPPLDDPKYETVAQASEWLDNREPVAMLELDGLARAYPLRILTWHEIVNDEIAGTPVAVTFVRCATAPSASTGASTAKRCDSASQAC